MRYYTPLDRGRVRTDPGWGSVLLVPLVLVAVLALGTALQRAPILVAGIGAGLLLGPLARAVRVLGGHTVGRMYGLLDNPLSALRARQQARVR